MTAPASVATSSLDELVPAIAEVFARYPEVAAAWVFGSVARGDARPDSDLDVGLIFRRRGDTALDHHRMLRCVAHELESLCRRRIDLVVLDLQITGPILCYTVLKEGRLVYSGDNDRRVDFESSTYVRYFDFKPTYDIAARNAIGGFRRWLEKRR